MNGRPFQSERRRAKSERAVYVKSSSTALRLTICPIQPLRHSRRGQLLLIPCEGELLEVSSKEGEESEEGPNEADPIVLIPLEPRSTSATPGTSPGFVREPAPPRGPEPQCIGEIQKGSRKNPLKEVANLAETSLGQRESPPRAKEGSPRGGRSPPKAKGSSPRAKASLLRARE